MSRLLTQPGAKAAQPVAKWVCGLLALIFCLLSPPSIAKETDYHAWLSAGARAKLVGGLYIDGTVVQRGELDFTDVHQVLPKVKLGFKPLDLLSLEAGVRYAYILEDGNQKVRLFQNVGVAIPLFWILELDYRLRFQQTHNVDKERWTPKIRNRGELSLSIIDLLKPGVYYEHFFNPDEAFGNMSTEYRAGLVVKSKLTKAHRLRMKFFQEAGLNGNDDLKYVCELAYRYHF